MTPLLTLSGSKFKVKLKQLTKAHRHIVLDDNESECGPAHSKKPIHLKNFAKYPKGIGVATHHLTLLVCNEKVVLIQCELKNVSLEARAKKSIYETFDCKDVPEENGWYIFKPNEKGNIKLKIITKDPVYICYRLIFKINHNGLKDKLFILDPFIKVSSGNQ